jgi:hypothetical protein
VRTFLICHHDADLHREGFARWLASFSTLAGILVIRESRDVVKRRARRELKRSGLAGFLDVLAFRAYYAASHGARDREWLARRLDDLRQRFAPIPTDTPILEVASPNSPEAVAFTAACAPDLALALCKTILKPSVFRIPVHGTWVMHPGICPEYRNAHGCFWALARRDLDKVGLTLLQVDEGVDTGPIHGYFSYDFDEIGESHFVIQTRMSLDNLDALRQALLAITDRRGNSVDIRGRTSGAWGQPRLSSYLRWKFLARRSARGHSRPALP